MAKASVKRIKEIAKIIENGVYNRDRYDIIAQEVLDILLDDLKKDLLKEFKKYEQKIKTSNK